MKYHRLTHEQFAELHEEFAVFLASQGIGHSQWEQIKDSQTQQLDVLLDLFSDLVWDKITAESDFLDFSTADQLFLFNTSDSKSASVIIIKLSNKEIDLTTPNGFQWLLTHLDSDELSFFNGSKTYGSSKNEFIYSYLKKGAVRSNGARFKALETYFSNSTK